MNAAIDIEATPAKAPEAQPQGMALQRVESGAVGNAESAAKAPITAAQAKVEAVASLTMSAYAKAATLKLTAEESAALQADFPDEAFKPGAAGKEHLLYVEHAFLRDRFTQVFGMGQWAIIPRNRWAEDFRTAKGVDGSRVYVEAMLVVRGCFVGEAVGAMEYYPKNESQNYGDAVEGAKTAAFRRCAKEFGVGLQAWKKDWCDAWWTRHRGGRDFSRKPAARQPQATPAYPAAGSPATPAPAAAPAVPKTGLLPGQAWPYDKMLDWTLKEVDKAGLTESLPEYLEKLENPAQLMPGENLQEWPLRFVPWSWPTLRLLLGKLQAFSAGQPAEAAFPAHEEPEPGKAPPPAPAPAPASAKPTGVPRDPSGPPPVPADAEWFMKLVVPIPRKGESRADYLKHPDTIGSLYVMRHGKDEESQAARQRLWGLVEHYEPKPWTKGDGTEMPPSDSDWKFHGALDAFADWFAREHPDEKL